MTEFVVIGHEAPRSGDFSLDDLAGGAGRLDVLCRCVTSALLVSHGVREDARIHLVVQDELTITVDGATVRRLNPDERSTAALLRGALNEREAAVGEMPVEASPGVELRRVGLEHTLERVGRSASIYQLHEEGQPIDTLEPPDRAAFVLADHREFGEPEAATVREHAVDRVRLGPVALHADQAITVAHHFLDTDGYAAF